MRFYLLDRTHSMTGRLALFFTIASLVIGLAVVAIFTFSLNWSEDRVGERRILIDKTHASKLYNQGHTGKLKIDSLTEAYDDIELVPAALRPMIEGKTEFLGETGVKGNERMVYVGETIIDGEKRVIYLFSDIDTVEFSDEEFTIVVSVALCVIASLLLAFGLLLFRMSRLLISPINSLSEQLEVNAGDTESPFVIKPSAAIEFKELTAQLNLYRDEISRLLKREQAFARYASHELRTPLTIIRGSNKLLQQKLCSPNGDSDKFENRQLKRIEDASLQMTSMVDALLSLVRYENLGDNAVSHHFSREELLSIIEANTQSTLEKKIPVKVSVTGEPVVSATPAILNMVVGNLLRNAVAATSEGIIQVSLNENALTIEDEGEGLCSRRTSDSPDSDAEKQQGHGLGLLIVEEFCNRYGWSFSLNERADRGCIAEIVFG